MPYQTEERIKSYLDSNQLHREQMCRAILAIDKRYTEVHPRHPRGGPDGGRDIEAVFRENHTTYGAVGFVNQANDSSEQKRSIKDKFNSDLKGALSAKSDLDAFVFFTNIALTVGEKDSLVSTAKASNVKHCEIFDRERMRISLDSTDGFAIRFQYLGISLSEEEQASFFARWGDDIQDVISTGFQKLEYGINRLLFLEESKIPITHFSVALELKDELQLKDIGHFRVFGALKLMRVSKDISGIKFCSANRPFRMADGTIYDATSETLKKLTSYNAIFSGEWHAQIDQERDITEWVEIRTSAGIGLNGNLKFVKISSFSNEGSPISLRDLDKSNLIILLNRSFAEKVKAVHIYSDSFMIQKFHSNEFGTSSPKTDIELPDFSEEELTDPWVRLFPSPYSYEDFLIDFSRKTPKRMFAPQQEEESFEHNLESHDELQD